MNLQMLYLRIQKLLFLIGHPRLIKALAQDQILASVEHAPILKDGYSTIIDVGANKGQFALACRALCPSAKIISFEPLPEAAKRFTKLFENDSKVSLYISALGPTRSEEVMHLSARDDSSSLLPLGVQQVSIFPGTEEVGTIKVNVAPLNDFLKPSDIIAPALLKIDVQGYEFEVLLGCETMLPLFERIYCECSFIELYTGQKLADSIVDWLYQHSFRLAGVYNMSYDESGKAIQADFMFERISHASVV